MNNSYYVYALKDPRPNPAKIFYIGKGTGNRAWSHITNIDDTPKGIFIKEIKASGKEVMITLLVSDLTEVQALKIESELISSFGTIDGGGTLYNTVIPTGTVQRIPRNINVPIGVVDKAQIGINLLKDALEEFAEANPEGITNAESSHCLGLQSDNDRQQQDYLTYSILGILLKESRVISVKKGSKRKYKHVKNT